MSEETPAELLQRLGIDGVLWAEEFMSLFKDKKDGIDKDLMLVWFCNSIMAGYDAGHKECKNE